MSSLATPRGPVVIRPTEPGDWVAYREMRLEALERHPTAYASDLLTSSAHPPAYWQDRIAQNADRITCVAVAQEELVGTTSCMRDQAARRRHCGFIIGVYVREPWRGLRLVDGLIQRCIQWAADQGIHKLQLGVTTHNTAAIRCYTRCGFTVYGFEKKAIYHDGGYYDELLMERSLDTA